MGMDEIKITGEPSRAGDRCAFTVDRPLLPGDSAHFAGPAESRHSPLAAELLAIPGIEGVLGNPERALELLDTALTRYHQARNHGTASSCSRNATSARSRNAWKYVCSSRWVSGSATTRPPPVTVSALYSTSPSLVGIGNTTNRLGNPASAILASPS